MAEDLQMSVKLSILTKLGVLPPIIQDHAPCLPDNVLAKRHWHQLHEAVPAGLAAGQLLKRKGHNVLILEGHSRPGGRVYTKKLKVSSSSAANKVPIFSTFIMMQAHVCKTVLKHGLCLIPIRLLCFFFSYYPI